jgi:hypothetical protein
VRPSIPERAWMAPPMNGVVSTPFLVDTFIRELRDYPFAELRAYVVDGLKFGFDTGVDVEEVRVSTQPLASARQHPEFISEWLTAGCANNHMVAFDHVPHPFARTCGIGCVPKPPKDGKKRHRFISDFSRPGSAGETAINEGIHKEEYRLKMISIWDAVEILHDFGPDSRFSAIDCKDGFRQLDVHPNLWHTQMYEWCDKFYIDKRLVFGSSSSPMIYDSVMLCVEYIIQKHVDAAVGKGNAHVRHFLDDFFLAGRTDAICSTASAVMMDVMKSLGIPLSPDKCHLDMVVGVYLGLELDCANATIALPSSKRDVIKGSLALLASGATTKKSDLLTLIGRLTYANAQYFHSRPLINPLLYTAATVKHNHQHCHVHNRTRAAAKEWMEVLDTSPPRPFSLRPVALHRLDFDADRAERVWGEQQHDVYVGDASAETGWGWFNHIAVCCGRWSEDQKASAAACTGTESFPDIGPTPNSSTLQELRCMYSALQYWAKQGQPDGAIFTYLTDARNLCYLMRKGRSKSFAVNALLLEMGRWMRKGTWGVRAIWHERERNLAQAADALSRTLLQEFTTLLPQHPGVVLRTIDSFAATMEV